MESVFFLDLFLVLSCSPWEDTECLSSHLVSAHCLLISYFTFLIAGFYLFFYPCIVAALHSYNKRKKEVEQRMGIVEEEEKKDVVKVSALVAKPRFLFGLFS